MSLGEILFSRTTGLAMVWSSSATMDATTSPPTDLVGAVTEQADFYPLFHTDLRRLKVLREVRVEWLNTHATSRASLNAAISINNGSSFSETQMLSIPASGVYQQSLATFDTEGRQFMLRLSSNSGCFYRIGRVYVMAESYGKEDG